MFKSLPKTATAIAMSLTLAFGTLAATTAPARADNNDVARFLAGAATLFIIGRAIDQHNRNRSAATVTRAPTPAPQPVPQTRYVYVAPDQCYENWNTPQGRVAGFNASCMRASLAPRTTLPNACLDNVYTYGGGWRQIYRERCMDRNGWVRSAALR